MYYVNDPLGVLGMAIERFQTFALYRDQRRLTKRFSIAWFFASWTFALCFLFVLLSQIKLEAEKVGQTTGKTTHNSPNYPDHQMIRNYFVTG